MGAIEPELQNLVRGIQIRFTRFYILVLGGRKITLPQYYVLATLVSEGALPMNQVAKLLHITKPAVTHLVDRLEAEGLIARDSHPHDRRVFLLHLTDKGRKVARGVQKRFLEFITHTLSKISREERATIKRFYQVLTHQLDKVLHHD